MSKSVQINMTEGSVVTKLLSFSIPLILSSVLQLLFNAADIVVVGRFAGDDSLAAVGSTGSLINLLVNLFTGLSIGTNVVAANFFGAGKKKEVQDSVHTAMLLSILSGIILTFVGVLGVEFILRLMQAPENVLKLAALYLKIYFGGITATMIYNFGSALLRAKGDTQRPLYILLITGTINLILNLIFVICFKMNVAGVGLATVISQCIAAFLIVLILCGEKDDFHLDLKQLKINSNILIKFIKIGLPAGFQGIMFSFSNVIIQSFVNSFGAVVIAGNSAACNLEGFIYTSMNGFSQGSLTFCSQNMGARKKDRIKKIVFISQIIVLFVGAILGAVFLFFGNLLMSIYSKNPEVVAAGLERLKVIFTTYYLCGMMDCMANSVRGTGHSLMPVVVTLIGACAYRLVWLYTLFNFEVFRTPFTIYVSYPISWILTFIAHTICFIICFRKIDFKQDVF